MRATVRRRSSPPGRSSDASTVAAVRRWTWLVILSLLLAVTACSQGATTSSDGSSVPTASSVEQDTAPTSEVAMDSRSQLARRLAAELGDEALASSTVAGLGDDVVDRLDVLADGDIAESPALSYAPTTVTADDVDTLWVFSYGYRLTPAAEAAGVTSDGAVPPIEALEPGPTNADLARIAAEFVAEHPVPVIAQWEVAASSRHSVSATSSPSGPTPPRTAPSPT